MKEEQREFFEEKVFGKRFLASIKKEGESQFLTSIGCPTKAELFARDDQGNYKDINISAMWFGFNLGLKFSCENRGDDNGK